ncbi:Ig-like domain repeat protein [Wenzhouxiangella sp. XN79A]|uniref:Ig-like domain repeat protein n=1 Tax=Wenzhouxiangella sp. XN79A TaxID=2724193 RepID=UPI00144AEFF3|nr:Ig-like domain-containing protein [Wenzhouxiangella sp. XN79A]NKI33996.1 Ig-like domain repeat protein [Wenzhouxiangella sp. XN79A]
MPRPFRLLLAATLLAGAGVVQAQLLGLTHDNGAVQVAAIDASSAVTPIGAPDLPTEVGYAAVAFDPFDGAIYALGPDPVAADGTLALFAFDTTTGVRTQIGNTGSIEQVAALRFELATQRLVAALFDSGTGSLRLAEVDAGTAGLTTINTGLADCCVLEPGVATERTGEVLLVGRRSTDPDTERYLIALSTSGDDAAGFTLLDGPLAAIVWDRIGMALYGIEQQTTPPPITVSTRLVEIEPAGTFTPRGPAQVDCCAMVPGLATTLLGDPDRIHALGHPLGAATGVLQWDVTTGAVAAPGSLPPTTVVNGLFDISGGLAPSTTTIDSVVPVPATIGQSYDVTVSIDSMAPIDGGTITVGDGLGGGCVIPVSISAPGGSCSLAATQVGPVTVTASYSGTTTIGPSVDTASQTVQPAPSTTDIVSVVPSPAEVGQAYTVSISVAGFGTPTGIVDIDDGQGETCQLVLPATSCALNAPGTGPRTITASYSGDVDNLPSTGTAAHEVIPATSTTTIDSIVPEPSLVGDAYTVNVTVTGVGPTGSVLVDDGAGNSCSIALPATACALANGAAGSLTITASYGGDANNAPSADSAPHVVDRAVSNTVIDSIAPNPAFAGQPYTVAASVTGFGTPTGTIEVSDDAGASCVISLPATGCDLVSNVAGARTISADYSGDGNHLPSGASGNQDIDPAPTVLTLTSSDSVVPQGVPVMLTASIGNGADPVTGSVRFEVGGQPITGCDAAPVAGAQATCMTAFPAQGIFTVTADYSGDANNDPAGGTLQLQVEPLAVPALSTPVLMLLALLLALVGTVVLRAGPGSGANA